MWTKAEQERLLKLIDLHPINQVAKSMRRSQSSIWHMLYRLGANAKMGKDSFTKYTLSVALHVRPETIEVWINRGWLHANQMQTILAEGRDDGNCTRAPSQTFPIGSGQDQARKKH